MATRLPVLSSVRERSRSDVKPDNSYQNCEIILWSLSRPNPAPMCNALKLSAYDYRNNQFGERTATAQFLASADEADARLVVEHGGGIVALSTAPKPDGCLRPGTASDLAVACELADCALELEEAARPILGALSQSKVSFGRLPRATRSGLSQKGLFAGHCGWSDFCDHGLKQFDKQKVVGAVDVQKFYESFTPDLIVEKLDAAKIPVKLIDQACDLVARMPRGLPQGTSFADVLSSVCFAPAARQINFLTSGYHYVDDFRVLGTSRSDASSRLCAIASILEDEGFTVAPNKTFIADGINGMFLLDGVPTGEVDMSEYALFHAEQRPVLDLVAAYGSPARVRRCVDWEQLYTDRVQNRSQLNIPPQLVKACIIGVGTANSRLLASDIPQLVKAHPWLIDHILKVGQSCSANGEFFHSLASSADVPAYVLARSLRRHQAWSPRSVPGNAARCALAHADANVRAAACYLASKSANAQLAYDVLVSLGREMITTNQLEIIGVGVLLEGNERRRFVRTVRDIGPLCERAATKLLRSEAA